MLFVCLLLVQVQIVPVTIDYEKPLEVLLHQNELLGEGKIKEVRLTLRAIV